jgi:hypothetical protein
MSRVSNPVRDNDKIDNEETLACHGQGLSVRFYLQR